MENSNKVQKCNKIAQRIVERLSRKELKDFIRNLPFIRIAEKFGVSDNTIIKWCKLVKLPHTKKRYKFLFIRRMGIDLVLRGLMYNPFVICERCGIGYEYLPEDIKTKMIGDDEWRFYAVTYITCPNCKKDHYFDKKYVYTHV